MGADIHIFIEYKVGDAPWQPDKNHKIIEDDGFKYTEQFPYSARDYSLFGALAGVRTKGPKPRGLPKDVSELLKNSTDALDQYGDDHSHSYCSFTKYKKLVKELGYKSTFKFKNITWQSHVDYDNRYSAGVAYIEQQLKTLKMDLEAEKQLLGQDINTQVKARLVFWFDN